MSKQLSVNSQGSPGQDRFWALRIHIAGNVGYGNHAQGRDLSAPGIRSHAERGSKENEVTLLCSQLAGVTRRTSSIVVIPASDF